MRPDVYRHIDPCVLWRAAGEDLAAFRSLSLTFVEIAPPMMERLAAALRAGDNAAAAHDSHSLAGTTMLVGASQLTGLLREIEVRARGADGIVEAIPLPALLQSFEHVMREVQASIDGFRGAPDCAGGPPA